ncbi:MAG: alanine racemase [Nitrospira sp.]|nr:alanine racemase [bacterium]MBL7049056.1 alanine racemase [Nitrospira sp.]
MSLPGATAEVDLNALKHNLSVVKNKTLHKKVIAVVKADAYGHGAEPISKALVSGGIDMLGVALTHEGIALREAGITAPVLVFFDRDNAGQCLKHNLTPAIFDLQAAKALSGEARKAGRIVPVHIKVDTGMGRIGLDIRKAEEDIAEISAMKNLRLEGLMSHFSEADLQDKAFALTQIDLFRTLIQKLAHKGITFQHLHMSNSAAVLSLPDAHFNMVRPGIMLYGNGCCSTDELKPVMSLKARILFIKKVPAGTPISYGRTFVTKRPSTIATIALGYADGYSRLLSNTGQALIKGQRVPIAGRVCMDTTMLDVTDLPEISYESEVMLMGRQGMEEITAENLAEQTGTIAYEVLTSVGQRVQRIYR